VTIHRLDETRSTNLEARGGRPGEVWTAEFQTAGRGRLDHTWQSRKGENLMFSAVLDCGDRLPEEVVTLPLVVGLAVIRALGAFTSAPLSLKWPNDVLAGGRKLCGILCERQGDAVIAGVGINVNQTEFPPEIAVRATSLARENGVPADRETVLQTVLASVFAWTDRWRAEGFAALHPEFSPCDCLRGRFVSVLQTDADETPVSGLCGGIAPDGSLTVAGKSVYAGEAHVFAGALPSDELQAVRPPDL